MDVHFSFSIAFMDSLALKWGPGKMMAAPNVKAHTLPITHPKVW